MEQRIIVATANSGKLREIAELFGDLPFRLVSMREHWNADIDIEENGETFFENACIKADWVYRTSNIMALADDSGLAVDALGGAPGVRSARFAGEPCNPAANNRKLIEQLAGVHFADRTARFVCCAVLRLDASTILRADGVCEGRIIETPRGKGGFGYDPLFVPDGFDRTFAELTNEEKNRISHRGRAMSILKEKFHEHLA
jgi:XTP/dITP diphosphohydrolase